MGEIECKALEHFHADTQKKGPLLAGLFWFCELANVFRRLGVTLTSNVPALLDASRLTCQFTEVINASSANFTALVHFHAIDEWRGDGEHAFNTDT